MQLKKIPRRERELLEIKRQQFIKENLYLSLLQKREETAIALASTTPRANVIDRPELIDTKPVSPRKIPIYGGALLLGLFLPLGLIIFKGIFQETIETEDDIREVTKLPILGVVPANRTRSEVVVQQGVNSVITEYFRLLRTNIRFHIPGEGPSTLLMTSSVSGEGKSFVAINLGLSFALSGKRVILIGLDLRKPEMVNYLNTTMPEKGMSDFLRGEAEISEIIEAYEPLANMFYIGSGPLPNNPSELLLNGKMPTMINELKAKFDFIIIDSPPVGLVTDSLLLTDLVSATIFVTRYRVTTKKQLAALDRLHQEKKIRKPAIILSDVKNAKSSYYGHYGR